MEKNGIRIVKGKSEQYAYTQPTPAMVPFLPITKKKLYSLALIYFNYIISIKPQNNPN